jgi:hypothetical protein
MGPATRPACVAVVAIKVRGDWVQATHLVVREGAVLGPPAPTRLVQTEHGHRWGGSLAGTLRYPSVPDGQNTCPLQTPSKLGSPGPLVSPRSHPTPRMPETPGGTKKQLKDMSPTINVGISFGPWPTRLTTVEHHSDYSETPRPLGLPRNPTNNQLKDMSPTVNVGISFGPWPTRLTTVDHH